MTLASKDSVDYGPGMAKSHCGPTIKWKNGTNPRTTCKYFYSTVDGNKCKKVAGVIGAADWCKLWEASA